MEIGMMQFAGLKNNQCAQTIEQALIAVDGVDAVRMSYDDADVAGASVTFNEEQTSLASLRRVIMDVGYKVTKPAHGEEGVCCGGCGG